ncbi:serine proteinase stubble isoform X1 [Tribolium madens]|uniref:serine proteinase stubble isoform X1 n=2 Tax=Tribolium madens TaxID=41895 RepID=UPI001CF745B0|nr:serine proteinase stubble isoform X1 [Tribolium madens]
MGSSMLWMAILGAILVWSAAPGASSRRGQAYQISPKPCWVDGQEGTCMFVYECIKSEGYHIGMCVDTFMFGSCCAHNATDNNVVPIQHDQPAVLYTPPSQHSHTTNKPISHSRPRPTSHSHLSQSTKPPNRPVTHTLAASVNVRPNLSSRNPTQPPRHTDALSGANSIAIGVYTKPGWQSTTEPGFITSHNQNSIQSGSKPQWQVTTEPAFVTRVKAKPSSYKPKPKPTKKPIQNTTKVGSKGTTTKATTKRPPTSASPVVNTEAPVQKVSTAPDLMQTSTIGSVVSSPISARVECGVPKMSTQPQSKIVGGKNAPFGRWPWQVSVRRTSFFGFSSTHRCGGAILNENWIATAGHCVDDLLTSQIRIRVGEYDFSSVQEEFPYVERAVARKVVHPKYNFFTYEYDLALVQLDKALEFAPHISPICLPASDDLLIGENATVTGWGRLSEGGTLPSVLQEVQVPIVSNDRCKSMFLRAGRHEFIPDIFLCAGHENGGRDSCQGDSGGPLQVKGKDGHYFLAGIISWGIGCAEANLPGVCTRISKFVPWILKHVT